MPNRLLSATEACLLLGIQAQTLYAYVARGRIRSEPLPGKRTRGYVREDVDHLLRRRDVRSAPVSAIQRPLDGGHAVLESSLTEILEGRLYYRGVDAIELAETSSIEEVALLLWGHFAEGEATLPPRAAAVNALLADLSPIDRLAAVVATLAADDPAAWDPRPAAGAAAAARVLRWLPTIATGSRQEGPVATALAAGWGRPASAPLLSAALVACADHELNVSAFTARCVASAGASVPDAIAAALSAMKGTRHGGQTALAELLLDEAATHGARAAISGRLRRGETVPGFGDPLYPEGDPRAGLLLERAVRSGTAAAGLIREVAAAGQAIVGDPANLDLGLAAVARVADLPPGSALALFAIGRSVGWAAHALEQASSGQLLRPRSRYVPG